MPKIIQHVYIVCLFVCYGGGVFLCFFCVCVCVIECTDRQYQRCFTMKNELMAVRSIVLRQTGWETTPSRSTFLLCYPYTHAHTYSLTHTCTCTYAHMLSWMPAYTGIYTHSSECKNKCMHTHTHTLKRTQSLLLIQVVFEK